MRSNHRIAVLGAALVVGWVGVRMTPAFAQRPDRNPPAAKIDGSAGSLRFRTDRQATERFEAARRQMQQGQLAEALRLLAQLPGEQLLVQGDQIVATSWAAEQLRRDIPPMQRSLYDAATAPAARSAWEQFESTQDEANLLAFCRDYGDTRSGLVGWQTMAVRHRDVGRWSLAASAWQRVLTHPQAEPEDRAAAIVGLIEAGSRSQQTDAVRNLIDRQRPLLETTPIAIAGEARNAAEFIDSLLSAMKDEPRTVPVIRQPAMTPLWTVALRPPRDLGPHLDQWFAELRDQGVWLLPAPVPLVTDQLVLLRSHQSLMAVDRASGRLVWQVPFDDWPWIDTNPGILDNAGFRMALLEQMARRLLADSVLTRLVRDDERVYLAQESRQTPGNPANFGSGPRLGEGPTVAERYNHLAAYRLDNGELVWKIGGPSAGPTYPLGGEYFCGPPTVVDDVLFVPGQQQTELQLLALDARRGELLWKTALGDLPRPLASDPARQRIACPVVWHDGVLLCPTAAGAIIAVDPHTRTPRWAYRYGVSPNESAYRQRNENTAYLPDHWWDAWREVAVECDGDTAVFVSPESDRLHALNLATGALRWQMPRDDGLLLLDVVDELALVAEPTAIRAHDLSNGRVIWRTAIGELAGRGIVAKSHLVVPVSAGGIVRLRLHTGEREPGVGFEEGPLGNLVTSGETWYSFSTDQLAAWPDVVEMKSRVEMALREDSSRANDLQAARLALQTGDAEFAWRRLRSERSAAAVSWSRAAIREILARDPQRWTEFRAVGNDRSAADRAELALHLSDAAAATGDIPSAAELLLDALHDAPVTGSMAFSNPRRLVRPDLALSGALVALMQRSDSLERAAIERILARRWNAAAHGTDPFAVQRLSERWSGLDFTHQQLASSDDGPFLGLPLLTIELRLLQAAGSNSVSVQTAAWEALMQQLARNGFPREADDYRRALLRGDHGPEAESLVQTSSEFEPSGESDWPTVVPQVESQRERNEDVFQFAVPMDHDATPLFDRLDVLVERQGRSVRFSGGGVSGTWTVALPSSNSTYRYFQHHTLGWGRGSLLILRVGFELFALAPFNDRGEPQGKVLWTLNIAGDPPPASDRVRLDVVPALAGIREDEYRVIDAYNRTVGQVGPVRAGHLCYAEKSKLVCIDTLTGGHRWTRYDLPTSFQVGGDDDRVFVWQPQTHRMDWLQSSDGRLIASQTWSVRPDDVILQSGRLFWYRAGDELVCEDRFTESVLWAHPLRAREIPFALSGRTLGVVRPGGELVLLTALTGSPQGEPLRFDGPAEIDRVVVSRDAERWYVAVSERVSQQAGLQQAQLRSGFRAPFVTGSVMAISRDQPAVLWQTRLEREPWPMDQPRAAPLLMQAFKLPSRDLQSGRQSDGVVQLRDKRNGQIVFRKQHAELIGYATLSADADRATVALQLERETVRLRYRPLPPPPALPDR